ncbi:probable G-protein coupled receptor 139 isoform X1 [Hypanus sabinus]|nr:probable G-protein coupled receptor 139 isoform X1 [Hypanus sabinus]XP_059816241.1 probable G-protein coupled receptor 139 isoform X1 [Hypanus sabinus]
MDHTPGGTAWNITRNEKNTFWMVPYILAEDDWLTVDYRMMSVFITIQVIFFPVLAIIALPVNTVTIFILSRGKCGLSRVVTCYLVAMAVADILVLILDLILSKIPLMYTPYLVFVLSMPKVCNIQAALIYTVTDCSVWFTVTFTFDRFVAICCQKLKTKYCTGKTAGVVLGTVTAISCLKNIYWYLRLSEIYTWSINPFICKKRDYYLNFTSEVDLFYYFLTPVFPFLLVLVTNVFTVRHVLVTSRTRRRLRVPGNGQSVRDPEMEKRRKSLVLLLIVSGNFILLWAPFTVFSAWDRICDLTNFVLPPESLRELGIILQLLSCCTNTALYAFTQTKFRVQLTNVVKSPLALFVVKKW